MRYIYFLNDFDILYIIILSDLFITMIYTYYFLFFQVASATATRYGLSRGLLGLEYDRINISDSDSEKVAQRGHSVVVPDGLAASAVFVGYAFIF